MHRTAHAELIDARYALLRSFGRDGAPGDTPIWFALDESRPLACFAGI